MQSAPSVTYPVGRSAIWAGAVMVLGVSIPVLLGLDAPGLSAPVIAGLGLAWLGWCALAGRSLARQPRGWLCYGGGGAPRREGDAPWRWRDMTGLHERPLAAVRVALDLQRMLLIELVSDTGAPRWLWLEARRAPADWPAMRRALRAAARP
jgi:hypothetical protein